MNMKSLQKALNSIVDNKHIPFRARAFVV